MTMFVFLHSIFDDNVAEIKTYMKNGLKYEFEADGARLSKKPLHLYTSPQHE